MPHKKKKIFTKDNSVKFLLVHGNTQALNAEGETLQNVLYPVSNNYKAGTSLLLSNISALCKLEENDNPDEEPDLENIIGQFDDISDSAEDEAKDLSFKTEYLTLKQKEKVKLFEDDDNEYCSDNSDYYDAVSQFTGITDDSFTMEFKDIKENIDFGDCPENLRILNDRFEKLLDEYDEDQIGALDDEEICGNLSTDCERVQNLLNSEFNQESEEILMLEKCDETLKQKILNYAEDSEEENTIAIVTKKTVEFDCESILSTYSNTYNHPTVIKEEKVKKIRIPNNPLKKTLTKSQLKTLDEKDKESDTESDNLSVITRFNIRTKRETPEERRERKNIFKEAKRESRILKKENKLAFKREKKLQNNQNINAQRSAGIKLL